MVSLFQGLFSDQLQCMVKILCMLVEIYLTLQQNEKMVIHVICTNV